MENELLDVVSSKLKEIRKIRCLSQEKVKDRTGIDVSCYECAKWFPKIATLIKLAQLFEVDITYFFNKN